MKNKFTSPFAFTGKEQSFYPKALVLRLLIVVLLFTICRLIFFIFNYSAFSSSTTTEILVAFLYGVRFDISAVIYVNILFILLLLIPNPYRAKRFYRWIVNLLFYICNFAALFFSVVDFEYFKFTKKRTTFDVFAMKSDFFRLLPEYVKDFWYLILILSILLLLTWRLYRKTEPKSAATKINYFLQIFYLTLFGSLFLIGARGGIQLKPLKIMDAVLYASPNTTQLVLNTPFTMIQTYGRKQLVEVHYMSEDSVKKYFSLDRHYRRPGSFLKKNVVIVIVESLSREFLKNYGAKISYTPFLDSLCNSSLVCSNSFSNGTRSMEAIPAVLASIPHLMRDSYIYSFYQGNRINSIGSLLSKKGYETAFFHGGTNGTMGFDSFIKMASFRKYYGRTEYNNDKDFDGLWGIYDEEFLQFVSHTLDETKQPFCVSVFTLSSHYPISIPPKYNNEFDVGTLPIHKGIKYADYALRKFFESASKTNWFSNTLFVITGDHTPEESETSFYRTPVGIFAVPIIFFEPGSSLKGFSKKITQHIDIMPTILDHLNYSDEFNSFGESIFDDSRKNYSFHFINEGYEICNDRYVYQYRDDKKNALYDYRVDDLLKNNLQSMLPEISNQFRTHLEAVIQTYNKAMIHDELTSRTMRQ